MIDWVQSLFAFRFVKFCTVGFSGVLVNLLSLALFADVIGIHLNLASAMAIELSINSNFVINELWTFRDRRRAGHRPRRWLKFHLVSLVGGLLQWAIFIACNALLHSLLTGGWPRDPGGQEGFVERYIVRPIAHPPDVGNLKYLSQLFGIGGATVWNYLANFYWTWARGSEAGDG